MEEDNGSVKAYLGIIIDYSRDKDIPEQGKALLTGKGFYKRDHENSPQETFARAATSYCFGDYEFAQRIYDYVSQGYFTFASPVLSNASEVDWPTFSEGEFEEAADWLAENVVPDGMPISCFLSMITDSKEGLVQNRSETAWLSMLGGGIGIYAANRSPDEKSTGVMAHLRGYDADTLSYKQTACYLPTTRLLTSEGWKSFQDVHGDELVAVVEDNGEVVFEKPLEWVDRDYQGNIHHFVNENRGFKVSVTANHKMAVKRKSRELGWSEEYSMVRADELALHNEVKFQTSAQVVEEVELSALKKFLIALAADGYMINTKPETSWGMGFRFSKERKIERLTGILESLGWEYTATKQKDGCTAFYVKSGHRQKGLEKIKLISPEEKLAAIREVAYWDGSFDSRLNDGTFTFSTKREEEADTLTSWCAVTGLGCRKSHDEKIGMFRVRVTEKNHILGEKVSRKVEKYNGKVSCCVVRTGKIIVEAGQVPLVCGNTRRGSMAAYLRVDHPEIKNFIQMRNPVGGDLNKKCFNMNNGVVFPDSFMVAVIKGEEYELVDPKHGPTGRFLDAREVWEEIMDLRFETGEPYVMFLDNVNRQIPSWITKPLYYVSQSNLCSEITLMTSKTRTAVCCLSSLNLEKYDEWKDTQIIADLVRFLDNVLEYFIRLAPAPLKRAVHSAYKERSLGLGTLGWHSYLQSRDMPFESGAFGAIDLTHDVYSDIKERAVEASLALGASRGEAPDCRGTGMRNAHLLAIAPNASSSSMVGASPSIEPFNANAFNAQGRAGSFLIKNKYLERVLQSYGENTKEVWKSIIMNEGSVQHLDFLSDHEKSVFKTASEIDSRWVVEQAAARQEYLCQSQSLNIFVPNDITAQEMSDLHIKGWMMGLKTFYYCRSKPATRANLGSGKERPLNSLDIKTKIDFDECLACSA